MSSGIERIGGPEVVLRRSGELRPASSPKDYRPAVRLRCGAMRYLALVSVLYVLLAGCGGKTEPPGDTITIGGKAVTVDDWR